MALKKFSRIFSDNPRYKRLIKPLEAANVCESARSLSEGRFNVISFRLGLLTLSVPNSSEAANLNFESENIRAQINKKLGEEKVERIRIRVQ